MSSQWYAIRVVSGQEKNVKQYIESEISRLGWQSVIENILIPMEKVYEMRNGKKRTRERNPLPGYMFLNLSLDAETMAIIKDVPNVIQFIGEERGRIPIPLREQEVARMIGKMEEIEQRGEVMENPFVLGESVKVMDGPFNGFDAVVEEVDDDRKKLKVSVKIFGRSTPLELKYAQVERLT
jgi:transcription termination/antitermination protein NusG